jgi:hypothetical protein
MPGLLSTALALAAGILLALAFDPVRGARPRWAAVSFTVCLGILAGIAANSVVFLFLAVCGIASAVSVFAADILVLVIAAALYIRVRRTSPPPLVSPEPGTFRFTWVLAIALVLVLLILAGRLTVMAEANPWGGWDALAMWNLRAKFLAGAPGDWHFAVNGTLADRMHPDYPLLLPSFIAAGWKAGGEMGALLPVTVSFLFSAVLVALLLSSVAMLRGTASGLLAALVMLTATSFLLAAPSQYADIPLACYWLSAGSLLLVSGAGSRAALIWTGACAGFGAWTKNEGVAFLVWFVLALMAGLWWKRGSRDALRCTGAALIGASPGILLTLWLKFVIAPPSDTLVQQSARSMLARLADASRYGEIAKSFADAVANMGSGIAHPLILLAILAVLLRWNPGPRYRLAMAISSVALGLMFLADIGAYLITPSDLAWHLGTSFDRLILQLWPSTLLMCFAAMNGIADPAPVPQTAHAPKKAPATRARGKRK